ncbi:MAG: imidazole glycerol phosphate synthase subunit HisH [Cyclobacteriaceae bacterium]
MKVAIVKYNAGNVQSLTFALNRLGLEPVLTNDIETLTSADKVIFPGQGEASSAMHSLKSNGLVDVLRNLKQPFLGVCLGMQLMCEFSEENQTDCLGILPLSVKKFESDHLKVPHMGWNTITDLKGPSFKEIKENDYMYFVHSYFVPLSAYTVAQCEYGTKFSTAIQYKNYYAIQPHPEKSADAGMKFLDNFLKL